MDVCGGRIKDLFANRKHTHFFGGNSLEGRRGLGRFLCLTFPMGHNIHNLSRNSPRAAMI